MSTNYTEQIAKIRNVQLGWESHGIFTCQIDLDYGGSGQGAGGYSLDGPRHDENGKFLGRVGTAYGMEWIIRLMRACGVEDFAQVKGCTVIALREDGYGGMVYGIKPLPTESGEPFMFNELAAEYEGVPA
jgi:hypothetical protein